jgi:methionyl-tRNA formyltransferase
VKLIFFGSPEFAVPSLARISAEPQFHVSLVVSQPDRKVGRTQEVTSPPVAALARKLGFSLSQPERIRDSDFVARLQAESPEAIVVVAYGKILPPQILQIPKHGCINLHASLLPRHRGASPIQAALLAGDARTGVVTIRMTEGLDEGPVYLHKHVAISESDDAGSLSKLLSERGADLLVETLRGLSRSELAAVAQRGDPTYCRPLRRTDGEIDWSKPADAILRARRAYSPWPGLFTFRNGERIKILDARLGPTSSGREPGELFSVDGEFAVACGSGTSIVPILLQREGKKPAGSAEFFRGLPGTARFGR